MSNEVIIDEPKLEDFHSRLIDETKQLEVKIFKLENFMSSEKKHSLSDIQDALLHVQITAMKTYLQCLKERIDRL